MASCLASTTFPHYSAASSKGPAGAVPLTLGGACASHLGPVTAAGSQRERDICYAVQARLIILGPP